MATFFGDNGPDAVRGIHPVEIDAIERSNRQLPPVYENAILLQFDGLFGKTNHTPGSNRSPVREPVFNGGESFVADSPAAPDLRSGARGHPEWAAGAWYPASLQASVGEGPWCARNTVLYAFDHLPAEGYVESLA